MSLAIAAIWIVDLALLSGGTPHPLDDTWEYGLVARSVLAGHGFRTVLIHPPLWTLRDASLTVPVLVHGPVMPLLLSPLVATLGPAAPWGAAWLAALFATLSAVFTARAVGRAAGRTAGVAAAALVTLSPTMVRMVHHDIAPAAGALAVALAIDLVCREHPRALAAGAVLGIGALVRPELLFAVPIAALVVGREAALKPIIACVLVIAPWAVHTFAATGSPFFNLSSYLLIGYTRSHPGLSPLTDFSIPPSQWPATLSRALPELPAKWLHMAPRAVKHVLMVPGPCLGLIAGLGAGVAWRSADTRRWAVAGVAAVAIPIVVVTLTESSDRYIAAFLPVLAAGAIHAARSVVRDPAAQRLGYVGLMLLALWFTAGTWTSESRHSAELARWIRRERSGLASSGTPERHGRLLFSDTPDFAAWLTGRPTVWVSRAQYETLPASVANDAPTPARGVAGDEWFHASVNALSPGGAMTLGVR